MVGEIYCYFKGIKMERNKMTIKSSISLNILLIFIIISGCIWELSEIVRIDGENPKDMMSMIAIVVVIMMLLIGYAFLGTFEMGKKLVMDKEGCTVIQFWGQKETYKWEELSVKQIVYNASIMSGSAYVGSSYNECVIFSPKPVNRKYSAYITSHEKTRYWKTLFYVNFVLEGKKKQPYMGLYEVEKEEFLSKMQEWGVELEDMREKK